MTTTMKLIAKVILGNTAAGMEFTSIPQTYSDLVLMVSSRTNESNALSDLNLYFNGTTSSPSQVGYSGRNLQGTGSSVTSATVSNFVVNSIQPGANATANTFGSTEFYIANYAGSTNKSVSFTGVQETNSASAYIRCGAWIWSNTAAITSIYAFAYMNFAAGSSAYLYGIKKS